MLFSGILTTSQPKPHITAPPKHFSSKSGGKRIHFPMKRKDNKGIILNNKKRYSVTWRLSRQFLNKKINDMFQTKPKVSSIKHS